MNEGFGERSEAAARLLPFLLSSLVVGEFYSSSPSYLPFAVHSLFCWHIVVEPMVWVVFLFFFFFFTTSVSRTNVSFRFQFGRPPTFSLSRFALSSLLSRFPHLCLSNTALCRDPPSLSLCVCLRSSKTDQRRDGRVGTRNVDERNRKRKPMNV